MSKQPFLALPSSNNTPVVLGLSLAYFFLFVIFYGGASVLSAYVPWRLHIDFPFESHILFVPSASIIYLSMVLLVCLAPLVLREFRSFFPLFTTFVAQTFIASVCFILLPIETSFPERHVEGLMAIPFTIADTLNLERNFLPSLHVSLAITAALAYGQRCAFNGKFLLVGWSLAIAASTLLIHEHHVIDVICGATLGWLTWKTVGKWAAKDEVLSNISIEINCLKNFYIFSCRHRRYLTIATALLLISLPKWNQHRVFRTGFCFLQAVDDLLDGDRFSSTEPLEVVDRLILSLKQNIFYDEPLSQLAKAFRQDLIAVGGSDALSDAISLMRLMQQDRRRILHSQLWGASQISEHLRLTFQYSVDLMLIAARSDIRSQDVPELIDAFGWCSVMRDLQEDINAGLINIPNEVIAKAFLERASISFDSLIATRSVSVWIENELQRAKELIHETNKKLEKLDSKSGITILRIFTKSIHNYAYRRIPKLYLTHT